ncbi:MAG: hypothetical protein LBG90_00640 [Spirochaetaceae bacterium]|nr:hypothetical protein [Spirochaetaceae bacterium]
MILEKIIKRGVVTVGGMNALILFIYAVGTKQGFMDLTQLMLLRWELQVGLLLGFISLLGFFLFFLNPKNNRKEFFRKISFWGYLISGLLGFVFALLAAFILVFTKGAES